jgi:hypothetical protein
MLCQEVLSNIIFISQQTLKKSCVIGYLPKIAKFFNISCALLNAFSPPLSNDSEKNVRIAARALELVDTANSMQVRVRREKLDRNTRNWILASEDIVPEFPILDEADFETVTLGIYQTKLATRYCQLHMDGNAEYSIFLNTEVPNVVRAKIESRFVSVKKYDLWISYAPNVHSAEGIVGYYCLCRQGARTVGCCAHIISV